MIAIIISLDKEDFIMRKIFDNTAHIRLRYPHFQQKVGNVAVSELLKSGGKTDAQASFFVAVKQQIYLFRKFPKKSNDELNEGIERSAVFS